MVTWSLETLLLALYVIAIICGSYITIKSILLSRKWGAFMFATFAAFFALRILLLPLVAGLVIIAAQAYFMSRRYTWQTLGRVYIYTVVCWAGSTYIVARKQGWVPDAWLSYATVADQGEGTTAVTTTEALLPVDGGRIWYRRTGTGSGVPVILIHGGPGIGSFSLKAYDALGDDRPIIRYDQLGAGHSDRTADTTKLSIASFVTQLDSLRSSLGYERVHIVGHAWGTIVGLEYYKAHPERVASLTFAGAVLNSRAWSRHASSLVATLSDTARKTIATREQTQDFDAPDYADAVREFNYRYVSIRPNESEVDSTLKTMNLDVRRYMWGPSEFRIMGALRTYDATRTLPHIAVPTLYTVGAFDAAGPLLVQRFAKLTPGAKLATIPDAANEVLWDNASEMLRVVREFLRAVDAGAASAVAAEN